MTLRLAQSLALSTVVVAAPQRGAGRSARGARKAALVAHFEVASEGRGAARHDVLHDASLRGVEVEACVCLVTMEAHDVGDVEPLGSRVRARPEGVDVGHAALSREQRR